MPVHTSRLQSLYKPGGGYAHLLPLLPMAMSRTPLADADLVITSHHAFAQTGPPRDRREAGQLRPLAGALDVGQRQARW